MHTTLSWLPEARDQAHSPDSRCIPGKAARLTGTASPSRPLGARLERAAWNGPAWNPPRLEPAPPCTQTSRGGVGAFYFSFLFQFHTSLWNRRATEIFQGSLHLRSQETKTSERRWKTQRRQKARRTPARAPWARNRRRSRHTAPLKKEQMFF